MDVLSFIPGVSWQYEQETTKAVYTGALESVELVSALEASDIVSTPEIVDL